MDLPTLQTVRLKGGMADASMIAAALDVDEADARAALAALAADDFVAERRGRYRVTPAGRDALQAALAAEREGLDATSTAALYDRFTAPNATFKQLVTDWQLRNGEPNDHEDADYDRSILDRLAALHAEFAPVAAEIAAVVPRLDGYPGRLASALERVNAGEPRFFASPTVDSYHQVWFELHEELIGVAGLERQAEAAAGRAE